MVKLQQLRAIMHYNNEQCTRLYSCRRDISGTGKDRKSASHAVKIAASKSLHHLLQKCPHHHCPPGEGIGGREFRSGWAGVGRKFLQILAAARTHPHTRTGSSDDAAGGELAGVGYGDALRLALRLSRSVARIWSNFPLSTRCSS